MIECGLLESIELRFTKHNIFRAFLKIVKLYDVDENLNFIKKVIPRCLI